MNLFEFAKEFRISIRKARLMQKMGVLRLENDESEHGAKIRQNLSRGQPLTVPQFLRMIEDPTILRELWRYRDKAESQLVALGDVHGEAAPREVAAYVSDAARGDKESINVLIDWMKTVIPSRPVTHHWLAVRLLMGIPASIREFDEPRIGRALLNCRKTLDFKGWWRICKSRSRTYTLYQRPELPFDL
jgi:hypothetical protein